VKEAIIAIMGTIVGFLLGLVKEFIENRPRIKTEFRNGTLHYFKEEVSDYGDISINKVLPKAATNIELVLIFDIFNIGKAGTAITDITICIMVNNEKSYFYPKVFLAFEDKLLEDTSFTIESNRGYTIKTILDIKKNDENYYMFNDIDLLPNRSNSLDIEVIIKSIGDKNVNIKVDPISIYTA